MPITICELCKQQFFYKGGVATICKRKKCRNKVEQMKKKYQKDYRKKTKDEFEKIREEMEKNREEVDKEYRERAGMSPKGGFYADMVEKDEKKDWANKKFEDIHGNIIENQTNHSGASASNFRQRSTKIV